MSRRGIRTAGCLLAASVGLAAGSAGAEAAPPNFFGVSSSTHPTAAEFQRLGAGGADLFRVQVNWATVEPTQGARNWQAIDAVVANAALAGVRFLPLLYGTPPWISSNPARPPIDSPQQLAAWTSFVHDLAARYGQAGSFWASRPELPRVPITHYQVWNEVNLSFFWGGRPSAKKYAALLRATTPALRAGDPSAQVILAGLIPFRTAGAGSVDGERYLSRLLKINGLGKLFDVVGIHPYGASPRIVLKAVEEFRRLLARAGSRRKPLWATEFGWTTGGEGFHKTPFRSSLSGQAKKLTKTYKLLVKNRKRLKLKSAIWFSFEDTDPPGADEWPTKMGLFDAGGQPKPSWFAYVRRTGGQP
jgi:hypothetical protein